MPKPWQSLFCSLLLEIQYRFHVKVTSGNIGLSMPVFLLLEQTSSRWIFIVSNNGTFPIHSSIIGSLGWFQNSVTIDMIVYLLDLHPNVRLQVSVVLYLLPGENTLVFGLY